MKYNILKNILAYSCLVFSAAAYAQSSTPASLELMKMKSLWMNSDNSAGLLLDNPIRYAELDGSYSATSGNFHRPQQGEKVNDLSFATEGGVKLNKIYAWGDFSYIRRSITNSNYQASIIDPYRGMPYIVADINPSDWDHQLVDLKFRAVSPVSQKLALGIEGSYNVASGAKMRDPRSVSYFLQLGVKPGVTYALSNQHIIGANLEYYYLQEAQTNSRLYSDYDHPYYELFGLGTAIQGLGGGRSTHYGGNAAGAAFQYSYQGAVSLLFNTSYAVKVEDAFSSYDIKPILVGSVVDYTWDSKLQLYKAGDRVGNYLTLEFLSRNIDGVEPINQYNTQSLKWDILRRDVRSTFQTQRFSGSYDFTIGSAREYSWKLGLGVQHTKQQDEYLLPFSEKNYENIRYQARVKKNFILSDALVRRLLIAADFSYNKNLSGAYVYGGSNPDNIIVKFVEPTDLSYLMSNYQTVGLSATYSQNISKSSNAHLFVRLSGKYTQTRDFDFDKRQTLVFSFGCNF